MFLLNERSEKLHSIGDYYIMKRLSDNGGRVTNFANVRKIVRMPDMGLLFTFQL